MGCADASGDEGLFGGHAATAGAAARAGGAPAGAGAGGGGASGATGATGDAGNAGSAGPASGGGAGASPSVALGVSFSPPGGIFVDGLDVELTPSDPRAELRYTLDGSTPGEESPRYEGPIELGSSTRVRVRIALPGDDRQPPLFAATYLRATPEAAEFRSNLPVAVIHTFDSGALDAMSDVFVPAWLSLFVPVEGETALLGAAALDCPIGIHVRGQTSRTFPKKQYAVELRDAPDGDDRELSLLGMPADSDWVLSDSVVFDRSLIRNALAYAISNRIGRYAPRTRFVEAFLVEHGGALESGDYLGVYTLVEKIARGADRVDVAQLGGTHTQLPEISGGYILSIDKGEAQLEAGGAAFQFVYPDAELMVADARAPQREYIAGFLDDIAEALAGPELVGEAHGLHYSELIDVDSFIDHQIVNALAKNVDGLRISTYFHKPRGGPLVAGPVWDFDRSFGTPYDARATEPEEWKLAGSDGTDYFEQGFWGRLFDDPSFAERYRRRFLELLDDPLSPSELESMIDELAAPLAEAAARNFERWPEFPPENGSHEAELAIVKSFLERRAAFIRSELEAGSP